MSQYTTGEIAKLCGVTVRTVQYYDSREILMPSELTEGGRRLYSEEDVKRLKVICMLRELGLSINVIGQLLREEDPASVIDVLLNQQEQVLRDEIAQRQEQLERIAELQRGLRSVEHFTVESIGDVAHVMENKKKLNKLYVRFLCMAIPVELVEIATIILWAATGIWWPFVVWLAAMIPITAWFVRYYHRKVAYICPKCHTTFRPAMKEFIFANHTLRTRKLTCTCCGHKGFCVETWGGDDK
ncbi:MAG: MerR family transcriptional regulator [Clostridia bacterium]|nr:MerR family transcriptional regulator [Clostridia bacterium]